jgi:hypothetical protein
VSRSSGVMLVLSVKENWTVVSRLDAAGSWDARGYNELCLICVA